MNKTRRINLLQIAVELEELKASLKELKEEEEEYQANIPENLQNSERYEKAENAICNLDDAISDLEEVIIKVEAAAE